MDREEREHYQQQVAEHARLGTDHWCEDFGCESVKKFLDALDASERRWNACDEERRELFVANEALARERDEARETDHQARVAWERAVLQPVVDELHAIEEDARALAQALDNCQAMLGAYTDEDIDPVTRSCAEAGRREGLTALARPGVRRLLEDK